MASLSYRTSSLERLFNVPWADLQPEHIRAFFADADEEGLLWEAKGAGVQPHAGSVRKAGCGFANSERGGYLIVGADGGKGSPWTLDGVEFNTPEPKTWLEQRIHELAPAPRCEAKVWPINKGRSAAVVRVEPVAAPPCITPDGVVYQRISGGTVPVTDPYVLAQLFQRGVQARETADQRASLMFEYHFDTPELFTLVVVPTGVSSDAVDDLYRGVRNVHCLEGALAIHSLQAGEREHHGGPTWSLRRVTMQRTIDPPSRAFFVTSKLDALVVDSDGPVLLQRCLVSGLRGEPPEPRGPGQLDIDDDVLPWFRAALEGACDLSRELGGHGDFRVAFLVRCNGRNIVQGQRYIDAPTVDFLNRYWLSSDPDESIETAVDQVRLDFLRFLAVAPRPIPEEQLES